MWIKYHSTSNVAMAHPTAADDNIVGKALGMEKEEWESKLDHYKKYGITITDALILMYAEKLTQYYDD